MSVPGCKRSPSLFERDKDGPSQKIPRTDGDCSVCGIIQRIKLENFMCHDVLNWEPNKNINFLIGENGSGKSSVLQGLVVGLMADSKHTKRYKRLQDFIQKGHSRAMVQVTLNNEGEEAYKNEVYGASITFQRTITDNGQSYFILMDHQLNVVKKATKKAREEGKRILEYFRINIDNPVAILQQEEAKELLNVESPGNLYTFFKKATLLDQCLNQYKAADNELQKTRNLNANKRLLMRDLNKQLVLKYEQIKEFENINEMDLEEKRLQGEFMWALIIEKKFEQEKIHETVALKESTLKIQREKLKSLQHVKIQQQRKMTMQGENLEMKRREYALEEREVYELKIETKMLKVEENEIRAAIKGYVYVKTSLQGEIRIMKKQLEQLDYNQNSIYKVKMVKERLRKLDTLEERMMEISKEIMMLGTERDKIDIQQDTSREKLALCENERKCCQSKVEHYESELADMKGMGDQRLAVFDKLAPRVAEEIRSAVKRKQFKNDPLGPVGSHIKLIGEANRNSPLARLLETELGTKQLQAYLCNDDKDRSVLRDIFNTVYGTQEKPQIFTSKFLSRRHNVRKMEGHFTVMDYMEITGSEQVATVIFNHLVDQKSIESVVVCKTQEEAMKICTFKNTVPLDLKYAITYDFNRFFPPTNSTSYRSYYMDPKTSLMLGVNMRNKLDEKRIDIQREKSTMEDINANVVVLLESKLKLQKQYETIKSRITDYRRVLEKVSSEKSQLKAEMETEDNLMETVQDQLEEKKGQYEQLSKVQATKMIEKERVEKFINEKGALFISKSKTFAQFREANEPAEKAFSKTEGEMSSTQKEILKQEKLLKSCMQDVTQLNTELKDKEKQEKTIWNQLKTKSGLDYVEPSGTVMQLNAKIRLIRETKKKSCQVLADREKLQDEYKELRDKYETQKRMLINIEEHVKMMEGMNNSRRSNFCFIRKTISSIIQRRFAILSESFSQELGTRIFISINHEKQELGLIFKDTDGETISTEIGTFSGGEKSFAQMCLIASLWETMNPPFRALDEWDVFLDALNRKDISSKLLQFGLTKLDYQFIFISPQGASDIIIDPSQMDRVSISEIKKS